MEQEGENVNDAEGRVSSLTLEERINSKDWKVRADAYEQLKGEIIEKRSDLDFVSFCGSLMAKLTADSNPNGLDLALDTAIIFFESCDTGWSHCDQDKLLNNIVDKSFGARQSTLQRGKALILKVIEGTDPNQLTLFLLSKLTDKRPKIAPICLDLITEGIILFGARNYPIKEVLKSVSPIFNSSNGNARESVMSLVVEMHKWIGLAPLQPLLESLRPAQRSDFDKLIASHTGGTPAPSLGLKRDRNNGVLLPQAAPAIEARDLVEELDLSRKLKGTEFQDLISSDKWADQAQGLDFLSSMIGATPKLKYNSAITEVLSSLNQLLKAGHIQVQIKCLKLLCMFADGCRSKVVTEMRNISTTVLHRSKEKKLSSEVEECLTLLYLYCISFDSGAEDYMELMMSKKNPPHCKICLSQILINLMQKSFTVSSESCRMIIQAFVVNADDSDAKVREITIRGLQSMRHFAESSKSKSTILQMIESFQSSNQKLYKRIVGDGGKQGLDTDVAKVDSKLNSEQSKNSSKSISIVKPAVVENRKASSTDERSVNNVRKPSANAFAEKADTESNIEISVSAEDALQALMEIPQFSAVATKLESSKWQDKVEAFTSLENSVELLSNVLEPLFVYLGQIAIWKSNNVNVLKAAVDLLRLVFQTQQNLSSKAVAMQLVDLLLEKIADKKLQKAIENVFEVIVVKGDSKLFIRKISSVVQTAKSPVVHQSILLWMKTVLEGLKLSQIPVPTLCQFCLKELENKTGNVRTSALEVVTLLYSRVGTPLTSCLYSKDTPPQIKSLLEQEFSKVEVIAAVEDKDESEGKLDIPRKDITEYLDKNIFNELNCIEGKDSWQIRKAALDKILDACNKSGHFLDFNKTSTETIKHLKQRLNDTQSNLKPLAAHALAHVISSFPSEKAIKCLKVVGSSILSGLADNKKAMRDSIISALETIVSLNGQKMDDGIFMVIVLASVEILSGPIGRLELLTWINSHQGLLHGDCAELVFSLVAALQGKTSQVRAESEALLSYLISHKLISRFVFDKSTRDLSPAVKRSIQAALDRILSSKDLSVSDNPSKIEAQIAVPVEIELPIHSLDVSQSTKQSRKEDWSKWPSLPSFPSLYDLAILKNKWKAQYKAVNAFSLDAQDIQPMFDYFSSLSNTEATDQSDYVFRWISFHISNSKDENRLEMLVQFSCEVLIKIAEHSEKLDSEEISLFLPFVYNRLNFLRHSVHIVTQLLKISSQVLSSQDLVNIALRCLPLVEPASRLALLEIVEFLFVLSSNHPVIILAEYSQSFSVFATPKASNAEKERCRKFAEFILVNSKDSSTLAIANNLKAALDSYLSLPLPQPRLKATEILDQPISVLAVIEEFLVVSNLTDQVSVARCRDLTDQTRIILDKGQLADETALQRRLPEFVDCLVHILRRFSAYDVCVIHSALALLHHLLSKQPIVFADTSLQTLKGFLFGLFELLEKFSNALSETIWRSVNLILVKFLRCVNPVTAVAALFEVAATSSFLKQLQIKLTLMILENGPSSDVPDEVLLKLFTRMNDYLVVEGQDRIVNIRLCKSVAQWLNSFVGSEKMEILLNSGVVALDHIKSVVMIDSLKKPNMKGEQIVDIIHEITYSKDKSGAIAKLYKLKQSNPEIDLNVYLSKLSVPFRKYVHEVFSKFEETENAGGNHSNELVDTKEPANSSEVMKIIENLKTKPPGFRAHEPGKISSVEESPISRRNERIRDSLSTLSKSLDLQTSFNDATKSQHAETLEERLLRLKSLK